MLILTRRCGETINIGNEVTLTMVAVDANQVRIGIQAPRTVAVHREEIYRRIQNEKLSGIEPPTPRELPARTARTLSISRPPRE